MPKAPTIAYVYWDALSDACSRCRAYDGLHWVPPHREVAGPPLAECQHPRGCRCVRVQALVDLAHDGGALHPDIELAERIVAAGGLMRQEDAFRLADALAAQRYEEQLAEGRRQWESTHPGAAIAEQARELEKTNPTEAIRLYHQAIRLQSQLCQTSRDPSDWTVFPRLYDRFSLVLEREGRLDDALALLGAYARSGCDVIASKSHRATIAKRHARILRKLGRPPPGTQ